tara:strand:- start:7114 stop:7674 length:561 start_codon:yes stop_codon:yes gene_type:complete
MEHFVTVVMEKQETKKLDESVFPLYETFDTEQDTTVMQIPLPRTLSEQESGEYAKRLANYLFAEGYEDFDIYVNADQEQDVTEVTYDGDDFYEEFGVMWFNEDDEVDEAEYQGRKVKLGKPMAGDVKKFKVYVKNPKGNVVKVNFGDKKMRIKKSNPKRRRSFRARHNCDNPGPRHKARYWSCRKW